MIFTDDSALTVKAVDENTDGSHRRPQFVRRGGDQIRLERRQPQVATDRLPGGNPDEDDQRQASQAGGHSDRTTPGERRLAEIGVHCHERQLPSRQPRARGNRLRIARFIGRKGDEPDAFRLHLVEEVVHHPFQTSGPIERDDAAVRRRHCPDPWQRCFADHIGEWRGAFRVGEFDRQPQCRLRRQPDVSIARPLVLHQAQVIPGGPVRVQQCPVVTEHEHTVSLLLRHQSREPLLWRGATFLQVRSVGPPGHHRATYRGSSEGSFSEAAPS